MLAVLAFGPVASAQAADFNVNNPNDSLSDGTCDADCTLRDAIVASNGSSSAGDVVNIPAGTWDTSDYGELVINREGGDLTVKGAGARDTIIDVKLEDRVLKIQNAVVTIQDLTITGGGYIWGGGGIANYGDTTTILRNVAIVDNEAGFECVKADAQAVCENSDGKGGGIFNSGDLKIELSEISGNTALGDPICGAGAGGGIYNNFKGHLSLTNVTVSDNAANDSGEECTDPGLGGGIATDPYVNQPADTRGEDTSTVDMLNVTLANNTAGLGGGIATVERIFAGDQAAAEVIPSTTAKNTIIANNIASQQQSDARIGSFQDNCYDPNTTIGSGGHNLVSDAGGADTSSACNLTDPSDKNGPDPLLGALANNGGPTNTRALNAGSPALDTADNSGCPGTDQRGVTRPQNVTCDIGAYEKEVVVPTPAPPAAAAAAVAQSKPTAKSSISGPRRCVRSSGTVRVSGQNIASVTYSLNGKKKTTRKGNKTSYKFTLTKSGVSRITAKVTYTSATAAKAQTKRFSVSRCAKKAAAPKFTG